MVIQQRNQANPEQVPATIQRLICGATGSIAITDADTASRKWIKNW